MLTADELYRRAKINPTGTTSWGEQVSSSGSGVYVISLDLAPQFVQLSSLADESELARWVKTAEAIVYIGRAKNLGKRLKQFRAHKYGARSPHRGGQAILLLDSPKTIRWAETEDYVAAEDRLIKAFLEHVGQRPYGNRMSSAQPKSPSGKMLSQASRL